jgi:hypothetical protein
MSRIALGSGLGLCLLLTACAVPPIGARIGLSAAGAAPTAAPAPAAAQEPPPAAAEPAPMTDAAPEVIATNGPLTLGGEVAGTLPAEGLRRVPFAVPKGHYLVELFIKAPAQHQCSGPPGADVTVIDRDEARVGNQFGGFTWAHDSWEKHQEAFDLVGGSYQLSVLSRKSCRVHFRVRLSNAS